MEESLDERAKKEQEKPDLDFFVVYRPWNSFMKHLLTPLDLYMLRSTCTALRKIIPKKPIIREKVKDEEIRNSFIVACREGNFLLAQFLRNRYFPNAEWKPLDVISNLPRTPGDLEFQLEITKRFDGSDLAHKVFSTENLDFLLKWENEDGIRSVAKRITQTEDPAKIGFARKLLLASFSVQTPINKLVEKIRHIGILKLGSLEIFREWEKRRLKSGKPFKDEILKDLDSCVGFGSVELIDYLWHMYETHDKAQLIAKAIQKNRPDILRYISDQDTVLNLRGLISAPTDMETAIVLLEWLQKSESSPCVGFGWDQVSDLEYAKFLWVNNALKPCSSVFTNNRYKPELVEYYMKQGFPVDQSAVKASIETDNYPLFEYCCENKAIDPKETLTEIIHHRAWKILEGIKKSPKSKIHPYLCSLIEDLKTDIEPLKLKSRSNMYIEKWLRWYKENVAPKIPEHQVESIFQEILFISISISKELLELLIQDDMLGTQVWKEKKFFNRDRIAIAVIKTGNLAWVKKIVNAGYDITPTYRILNWVAKIDSPEMLDYLMENLGIRPDFSCLEKAIKHGSHKVFQRLLELNVGFPEEKSLIDLATTYCQPKMADLLREKYSDPDYLDFTSRQALDDEKDRKERMAKYGQNIFNLFLSST